MAETCVGRWAWLLVAAAGFISETALASPPAAAGPPGLRPWRHRDRLGRTVDDVCPEHVPRQRRCFAQRFAAGEASGPATESPAPARAPDAPFPGFGDMSCQPTGAAGASSPPPGTMAPSDVLAAYDIPASTKAGGKIVALVELPSVHAMADVNTYRRQFGIPELPACPVDASGVPAPEGTACFARVGEDGSTTSVTATDCAGWSGETGLDMDMVSAACPDCSIVVVEANNTNDLDAMNSVAATVLKAAAVSDSWGGPESGQDSPLAYDNPGTLIFAASGDSGYLNEALGGLGGAPGVSFPASLPTVIGVGGTTLQPSGGKYSEVVWNDAATGGGVLGGGPMSAGGSGCSQEFSRPSWQSASAFDFGSCSARASVDISAAAQFEPGGFGGGIAAYDADDNGWNAVEGTSASAPLVAAIMVRLGLAGKDNHQLFYDHIDAFNDVTSGTNDIQGLCSDVMCTAAKGWDGPTGLGTPNGAKLAALAEPLAATNVDAGAFRDAGAAFAAPDAAGAKADAGTGQTSHVEQDAALDDAGPEAEAGIGDNGNAGISKDLLPMNSSSGCSCHSASTSGGDSGAAAVAAASIVLAVRRRGRSRRTD